MQRACTQYITNNGRLTLITVAGIIARRMDVPPGIPEENLRQDPNEPVETRLARYAFVREERDREVRLLFRDVPAPEIVGAFRMAGATLISISGERAKPKTRSAKPKKPVETTGAVEEQPATAEATTDYKSESRTAVTTTTPDAPQGEVTLRYFFALGETVYTVSVVIPSGVSASVAAIYPSAQLSERELQSRLEMVFTN